MSARHSYIADHNRRVRGEIGRIDAELNRLDTETHQATIESTRAVEIRNIMTRLRARKALLVTRIIKL